MSLAWVWSQYQGVLPEAGVLSPQPQNTLQPTAWIWSQYRGVQGETSQTRFTEDDEISLAWVWSAFKGVTPADETRHISGALEGSSSLSTQTAQVDAGAAAAPSAATPILFYLGLIALSALFALLSKIDYSEPSLLHLARNSHNASCAEAPDAKLSAILYVQKLAESVNCN